MHGEKHGIERDSKTDSLLFSDRHQDVQRASPRSDSCLARERNALINNACLKRPCNHGGPQTLIDALRYESVRSAGSFTATGWCSAASPAVVGQNEVHPLSVCTLLDYYLFYFWILKTFTPLCFEEKCCTLNSWKRQLCFLLLVAVWYWAVPWS